MLPIAPKIRSATPMALFKGQKYQAMLMSHLQSSDPVHYDSLFMVNPIGKEEFCLIVSLESEVAGQPLTLAVYGEKGRQVLPSKPDYRREQFLAYALFIVETTLHERLAILPLPQVKLPVEEKTLAEFYPDAKQRLQLHYHFAHRWLPAYVKSDPARFFGYFQRREENPTRFIQARWQIMEKEVGRLPDQAQMPTVIRRVKELQMWVEMPDWAFINPPGKAVPAVPAEQRVSVPLPVAVVQMPSPEFVTHAYFIGIVLLATVGEAETGVKPIARVFTLEKIDQNPSEGRLCEWMNVKEGLNHRNYGTAVPVQQGEFVKAFLAKVEEVASSS